MGSRRWLTRLVGRTDHRTTRSYLVSTHNATRTPDRFRIRARTGTKSPARIDSAWCSAYPAKQLPTAEKNPSQIIDMNGDGSHIPAWWIPQTIVPAGKAASPRSANAAQGALKNLETKILMPNAALCRSRWRLSPYEAPGQRMALRLRKLKGQRLSAPVKG